MAKIQIDNSNVDNVLVKDLDILDIDPQLSLNAVSAFVQKIGKDVQFSNVVFSCKKCNIQQKEAIFKVLLENEDVCFNRQLMVNLINLIKTYNNFQDKFFESEFTLFSDIEEFLDIKLDLKDYIQNFIDKLAGYYLSLFVNVHRNVSSCFLQKHIQLPLVFQVLLDNLDLYTLSGICENAKFENVKMCQFPILNAKELTSQLFDKWKVTSTLFTSILDNINKNQQQQTSENNAS